MDRQQKEANKLMPSDGYHDEGVWGEAAAPQDNTSGAGRAGVTTRKNTKKKDDKELLALIGALPSGAVKKSSGKNSSRRKKVEKKRSLDKAKTNKTPVARKKSGRSRKRGSKEKTPPAASAPPGAATPAAASRSATSTGRGKRNSKSSEKAIKAERKKTVSKSKRGAGAKQPASKKSAKKTKGKGKAKAAKEPSHHILETEESDKELVVEELTVQDPLNLDNIRMSKLVHAVFCFEMAAASAGPPSSKCPETLAGVADRDGSRNEGATAGGGSAADGMSHFDYLDMAADVLDSDESVGVGAGGGSTALGGSAAGGGSSGWGEDDEEL